MWNYKTRKQNKTEILTRDRLGMTRNKEAELEDRLAIFTEFKFLSNKDFLFSTITP